MSSEKLSYRPLYNRFYVIGIIVLVLFTAVIIHIGSGKFYINLSFAKYMSSFTFSTRSYSRIVHSTFPPSRRRFDVVLSYYAENVVFVARFITYLRNVTTLQQLKLFIIVYNKNSNISNFYLKDALKADLVQQLPNVGREGGSYLYHIITHYDTLAHHTLFSQAGVEGISNTGLESWFSDRLEKQFNSTVGYMPLVHINWMAVYDCGLNPLNNMLRLAELWALIEQTLCPPDKQAIAYRGQFVVSSQRIRKRPLRIYKYINDLLTANSTHWIHKDPRSPIGESTPSNPFFGHIVERLWTVLFDCAKPTLLDRCQQNACACFD